MDTPHDQAPHEEGGVQEKIIDAVKLTAFFPDAAILEEIADKLQAEGTISGFYVDKIRAGYSHAAQKVKENQYALNILVEESTAESVREKIQVAFMEKIAEQWDVPAVVLQHVQVNESLLHFVERAPIEHKKFLDQRRMKLVIGMTALMSISSILGVLGERYVEKEERRATAEANRKAHERIVGLRKRVEAKVVDIQGKLNRGEQLQALPTDMAADVYYKETEDLLAVLTEAEKETSELSK